MLQQKVRDLQVICSQAHNSVTVWKGIYNATNAPCAAKVTTCVNEDQLDKARQESDLVESLKHPNIVEIFETFTEDAVPRGQNFSIIMELFERGDLLAEITRRNAAQEWWSEKELIPLFWKFISAFAQVQRMGVAHRDIKPGNVFMTTSGDIKIADFGASKSGVEKDITSEASLAGTPSYLSPILMGALREYQETDDREILLQIQHNIYKSDVYSLGLMFYYMITCIRAQLNTPSPMLARRIETAIMNVQRSDKLRDLLRKMLELDESIRPDFLELEQIMIDLGWNTTEVYQPIPLKKKISSEKYEQDDDSWEETIEESSPHAALGAIVREEEKRNKMTEEELSDFYRKQQTGFNTTQSDILIHFKKNSKNLTIFKPLEELKTPNRAIPPPEPYSFKLDSFWIQISPDQWVITGGYRTNISSQYNIQDNSITLLNPMQYNHFQHTGVYHQGAVYIFGGLEAPGYATNFNEMYPLEAEDWIAIAPMALPRNLHSACIFEDYIYIAGGLSNPCIERFNPMRNRMDLLPIALPHRLAVCLISTPDGIYALLEKTGVFKIDPRTETIKDACDLQDKDHTWPSTPPIVLQNKAYLVRKDIFWEFDLATMQLTKL